MLNKTIEGFKHSWWLQPSSNHLLSIFPSSTTHHAASAAKLPIKRINKIDKKVTSNKTDELKQVIDSIPNLITPRAHQRPDTLSDDSLLQGKKLTILVDSAE